jgi:hypothetical protein
MDRERREGGIEMRGWEEMGVDPQSVQAYYEQGFPWLFSRSSIARLRWVSERLLPRSDYFQSQAQFINPKHVAGTCSTSPGDRVSDIRLSTLAHHHHQPEDIIIALNDNNHEEAHARSMQNAPEYIPREARLVGWWSVYDLMRNPDHPQSPYHNSIFNADAQLQTLNRLIEYFAEIERMVYESREPLPPNEDWERFKARTIAETYNCSPAAALRAVKISEYWAVQFQPEDEAEGFDWAGAERARYAYRQRLLQERTRSLTLAQIDDLSDPQMHETLLEGLKSSRTPSAMSDQSVSEAGAELRDVLNYRNYLFGSFGDLLRRVMQNDQVTQQVLRDCWVSFSLNLQSYNQAYRRLTPAELERLHDLTARDERRRQIIERHESRLALHD